MVTDKVGMNFYPQNAFCCRLHHATYDSFIGPGRQAVYQCVYSGEDCQCPRCAEAEQLQNAAEHGKGRQNVQPCCQQGQKEHQQDLPRMEAPTCCMIW